MAAFNNNKRKFRKKRTTGQDMCSCGSLGCDSAAHWGTIYGAKKDRRNKNKECIGCGKKECNCKRTLSAPRPNNKEIKDFIIKQVRRRKSVESLLLNMLVCSKFKIKQEEGKEHIWKLINEEILGFDKQWRLFLDDK